MDNLGDFSLWEVCFFGVVFLPSFSWSSGSMSRRMPCSASSQLAFGAQNLEVYDFLFEMSS